MVTPTNQKIQSPSLPDNPEVSPLSPNPLEELNLKIRRLTAEFKSHPITPQSTRQFERGLDQAHQECNRQIKEQTLQQLESPKK